MAVLDKLSVIGEERHLVKKMITFTPYYEKLEKTKDADSILRTSVSSVVGVVWLLFFIAGFWLSFTEFYIIITGNSDITKVSSAAGLDYLLGPLRYLMFHYAATWWIALIRGFLVLAVIPWLAGIIAAFISAGIFRGGKQHLDICCLDFLPLVGVLSWIVSVLSVCKLAGMEQRSFIAGVRYLSAQWCPAEDIQSLILFLLIISVPLAILAFIVVVFFCIFTEEIWGPNTPFTTDHYFKKKQRESDREYYPTSSSEWHAPDYIYTDTGSTSSAIDRDRINDELDAIIEGMRLSETYGSDWRGYDPEAPGPDPEAPLSSSDIW